MEKYKVGELHYACRDIGYGVEEDWITGYFTDDVDTLAGKLTFLPIDADGPLYLFEDELRNWAPLGEHGRN